MCRRFVLVLAVATLASASGAQSASSAPPPPNPPPALQASSRFNVLSVVVQDQEGQPVRGLNAQNFRVTEGGVPQTIARMEEHSSQASPLTAPSFPSLPPGTFTNYTPIARGETLNILLIDALNTPLKGEGFVRSQLLQYVRHANPNTRIAVLGLANHLILLQDFTSDPSALRDVVERKLIVRSPASPAPPDANPHGVSNLSTGSSASSSAASRATKGSPSAINLAANLRAFEEQLDVMETDFGVQYTLDAFNTLAHYLGAFPGRKNLIWFSGSFPLNIVPDASLPHPFDVANTDADELRETVELLLKAQVAVYPVDARSLIAQSATNAKPGSSTNHAHSFSINLSKVNQSQAAEHATMEAIAASTGGRAFYNPESLADAVDKAVAAGSNYYTLIYSPASPDDSSSYRQIHVDTTGVDAEQPLQLSYRRGDYSDNTASHPQGNGSNNPSATTSEQGRAAAYQQAAMSRGGPAPADLLFRVRVLPASSTTETVLAPDNQLAPVVPSNGPFRRYDLDFLALPGELTFTQQPDGHRRAKVEFLAYVFDTEGKLLATTGKGITLEPKTNDASKLARSLIRYHLEVSVPDRAETFLRIGMRDVTSNKFGVVEIPTSAVTSLPPAIYAPVTQPSSQPAPAPVGPGGRSIPPQV
jgi:VWFA-related protein